jgi:hypothetical protein
MSRNQDKKFEWAEIKIKNLNGQKSMLNFLEFKNQVKNFEYIKIKTKIFEY